jgi:hypothetical protein
MIDQSAGAVFKHPVGIFPLPIKERGVDGIFQALLSSEQSYIMLAADHLDEESRSVALDFVELA